MIKFAALISKDNESPIPIRLYKMKKAAWITVFFLALYSCKKEPRWEIDQPVGDAQLAYTNLSALFYDTANPLNELQQKYPFFFQADIKDEVWEEQRRDSLELEVFDSVNMVFANQEFKKDLSKLYGRYHYYFPNDLIPHVYLYSSGLQNIYEPVIYGRYEGMLFIALDGFLGGRSRFYQMEQVYPYLAEHMTKEMLMPSIAAAIAEEITPFNPRQQTLADLMVDEGKKLVVADALLPDTADELKIGYTKEALEWSRENEAEIWNYFVEQDMLFDSDASLRQRFLEPAPFSKFNNEVEAESPGRIGAWVGWMICRSYLERNPELSLQQFLNEDTQTIFRESKYKPKK